MAYSTESHMDTDGSRLAKKKFHLVWLADNIEELKKNHPQSFEHLRNIDTSIDSFNDGERFVNFLFDNTDQKIVMIVTGALGEGTVPIVHDMSQLDSIFVLCYHKTHHEKWAKDWSKVKGVFNQIDVMCQAIEQAVQQPEVTKPKPTLVLPKSPPTVRRPLTPEPPSRTTHHDGTGHRHRSRSRHSALPIQTDVDTTNNTTLHVEPMKKERRTPTASPRRDAWVEPIAIPDKQYETPHSRESSSSSLLNSKARTTTVTPNSQQQLPLDSDEFQHTLTRTTEKIQRLLTNNDVQPSPPFNINTMDQLQDSFMQTIKKHVTKKNDDSNELAHLFADLKQVLLDALVQQQQQQQQHILSHDVIKQTVLDVLSEEKNLVTNPTTTTELRNHRKPITTATSREVKITANLKLTRTDAAFRQERDAVVANKRLRDAVQQWSSVRSMADLVTTIKTHGKNNLECAWLLFCWIGQNIQYQAYCNNNSAETVFRTKQGVCRGFVSLYHECCSLLGIECSEISGYAKQAFLKPGEDLKQSPHAWNSIVLDQYTYLIDPTWGAGGRDNDNKLEDFYFLTSPEELIYTHYSNGYQLLVPEISKKDFLDLPVMKSIYYRLGLTLLSPKQGVNEINENLFKITIRTPKNVDLFIALKVGDIEYPRSLHTLCQRDHIQSDVYNCYVAPPLNGLYDVAIYAKTNNETLYRDAINMRLRVLNIVDAFTFPHIYSSFTEHNCILIEPLQRLVYENEEVLIHMIIPHANVVKIQNGDDYIVPGKDEYKGGVLQKKVRVQGDLHICGRWDDKADSISILCVFNKL